MDCARHIPLQLENTLLIVRCGVGGFQDQSFPVRCSRISPVQAGQAIVERLLMCNFDATAVAMQIAAESSEEEVDVKQACQGYIESEEVGRKSKRSERSRRVGESGCALCGRWRMGRRARCRSGED